MFSDLLIPREKVPRDDVGHVSLYCCRVSFATGQGIICLLQLLVHLAFGWILVFKVYCGLDILRDKA